MIDTPDQHTAWPDLPSGEWADTVEAIHLWAQIVGKIRLGYSPWLNHSWGVALYVSTRGLRTSLIPFGSDGVELELDFLGHELNVHTTSGQRASIPLRSSSIADMHRQVTAVGMPVSIDPMPSEIPDEASRTFPDDVAREAYSHEVTSVGFWPGNRETPEPIFYSYAYPTPDSFSSATVQPPAAQWLDDLGEFALTYAAVAAADDPDATLLSLFETTHAAAADLAGWDRDRLEGEHPEGPEWWRNLPLEDS